MSIEAEKLINLRNKYGFSTPFAGEFDDIYPHIAYSVVAGEGQSLDGALIGVDATTSGRFGNGVDACIRAIVVAKSYNLRFVKLVDVDGFRNFEPFEEQGILVVPASATLPTEGVFLRGPCEYKHFPEALISQGLANLHNIELRFLRRAIGIEKGSSLPDELVIHIRSGDIFSTYVHPSYVQPPLYFYKTVIERLFREGKITRVMVVYEDKGNPCVDAVDEYLQSSRFNYRMQSSSFIEDLAAMIDCNHFAFGFGTLGWAVCRLSKKIETAHYFWGSNDPTGFVFNSVHSLYEYIPTCEYINIGDWANTPEQRKQMLTFPANCIRCLEPGTTIDHTGWPGFLSAP